MNETHIMPQDFDGAKHISTSGCPCRPELEAKDPATGDETWLHRNY
ncbi:MAG: hypothetical protein HY890_05670 [Deltaproteobacteria bacterium]|nr:hypothetical protein [Deltaproteobacteria bacterium]